MEDIEKKFIPEIPLAQDCFDASCKIMDGLDISSLIEDIINGIVKSRDLGLFVSYCGPYKDILIAEKIAIILGEKGYFANTYNMGVQQYGVSINWKFVDRNSRERFN